MSKLDPAGNLFSEPPTQEEMNTDLVPRLLDHLGSVDIPTLSPLPLLRQARTHWGGEADEINLVALAWTEYAQLARNDHESEIQVDDEHARNDHESEIQVDDEPPKKKRRLM